MDLKASLELVEKRHLDNQQIQNDPLSRVLQFNQAQDQEVVALISAAFAYGNVKQILRTLDQILSYIGPAPSQKLKETHAYQWKKIISPQFKHRFNTANDLGVFLSWIGGALREFGSLENLFVSQVGSLEERLNGFITKITSYECTPYKLPKTKGPYFFLPKPENKSGCKRMLLFLRWMAGTGPMAVGIWKKVDPAELVIPVDTHVLRISKNLGLTKGKHASWKTALEITESLKKLTPNDPTRYDFAICHLGISQACPSRFQISVCRDCGMNHLCQTYRKNRRA